MALTPELEKLKNSLEATGYAKRTLVQDRLLSELEAIDRLVLRQSIEKSSFAQATKMTSPGGDTCSCCGR